MADQQTLKLRKGEHLWVFRWPAGAEVKIIDAFAALAINPASQFDWYDAALLGHKISERLFQAIDDPAAYPELWDNVAGKLMEDLNDAYEA